MRYLLSACVILLLTSCSSFFKEPTGKARSEMEQRAAATEREPDLAQRSADDSERLRSLGK